MTTHAIFGRNLVAELGVCRWQKLDTFHPPSLPVRYLVTAE